MKRNTLCRLQYSLQKANIQQNLIFFPLFYPTKKTNKVFITKKHYSSRYNLIIDTNLTENNDGQELNYNSLNFVCESLGLAGTSCGGKGAGVGGGIGKFIISSTQFSECRHLSE